MLKSAIFHFLADNDADSSEKFVEGMTKYDKDIQYFIEQISEEGHTFVSINQVAYGRLKGLNNRIRTIIVYFENLTRKVIIEKH